MKPCSRMTLHSNALLQNLGFGVNTTVADIKGTTKKLGSNYSDATIVLYNKSNLTPIGITKPSENGDYQFLGLNNSVACFIVAFDNKKQYNAVIQDQVVPK
ncbi:hypothetical protein F885_00344 [Acinetobacter higginsii]|uniref:hypothetical protein n=1 Tax=Acinetobacter higginsii TaxID=70347 RepID=UPI0002CDA995|nr:hypothetical protein [Acinetobacter higginsii]ENX63602.1 hypothetical protein F885_00344 [Acinetobacter higginsii]